MIQRYDPIDKTKPIEVGMLSEDGRFVLTAEHFAALKQVEEEKEQVDWQLKYDLLMADYEQKWGLSMRQAEQLAALTAERDALDAELAALGKEKA